MRVSGRLPACAAVCFSIFWLFSFCLPSRATAQQSDEAVAERVLGAQWKQLSRRSGMIFAGTVLPPVITPASSEPVESRNLVYPAAAIDRMAIDRTTIDHLAIDRLRPTTVEIRFHVDIAIVGVEHGQVVTIHEWSGAYSQHRPIKNGEHVLIFLYPPSQLGFTSPVGGTRGVLAVDSSSKNLTGQAPAGSRLLNESSLHPREPDDTNRVSVVQLERAIRRARAD